MCFFLRLLVAVRPFAKCPGTLAEVDVEVGFRQIQVLADAFQVILVDGFQKPRGATDVPEEFIHGEAIRRRRILVGELPRLPVERNAAPLRLVEHADAELAPCRRSRKPGERSLGGMGFPRIDLAVRLCHLRKHSEQPPQEHILALHQPLLDVVAFQIFSIPCHVCAK